MCETEVVDESGSVIGKISGENASQLEGSYVDEEGSPFHAALNRLRAIANSLLLGDVINQDVCIFRVLFPPRSRFGEE